MASVPTAGPSGINDDDRDPQDYELWAVIESAEAEARNAALNSHILVAIGLREVNLHLLLQNARLSARSETQQTRLSIANDCRVYGDRILSEERPGFREAAAKWYHDAFDAHYRGRLLDHPAVMDAQYAYALDLKSTSDFSGAINALRKNLSVRIQKCGEHDVQTQKARFELAKIHEKVASITLEGGYISRGRKHAELALEQFQALLRGSPTPIDEAEDSDHFYVILHLAFVLYLLGRYEEAEEHFETCLELIASHNKWQERQPLIKNYIAACTSGGPPPVSAADTTHELNEQVQTSQNEHQDTPAGKAHREQEPEAYKGRTLSANATDDPTKWVQGLRRTHKLLGIRNGRVRLKYEHVKIAILDTGIDGSLQHVYCSENIIEWKSWIPGDAQEATYLQGNRQLIEQVCIDRDGHGTHLAAVIMDVNPLAKLYVARIAGKWNEINPEYVAKVRPTPHHASCVAYNLLTINPGNQARIAGMESRHHHHVSRLQGPTDQDCTGDRKRPERAHVRRRIKRRPPRPRAHVSRVRLQSDPRQLGRLPRRSQSRQRTADGLQRLHDPRRGCRFAIHHARLVRPWGRARNAIRLLRRDGSHGRHCISIPRVLAAGSTDGRQRQGQGKDARCRVLDEEEHD